MTATAIQKNLNRLVMNLTCESKGRCGAIAGKGIVENGRLN